MRSWLVMATISTAIAAASGCGDSASPAQPSVTPTASATPNSSPAPPAPPPPAPPPPAPPPSPPEKPRTLRRATFESANGYVTEGTARIQDDAGKAMLELDSDFRTSNSAALDVRLCRNRDCTGDHVSLGALKRAAGGQSYGLDDNGAGYDWVTIYCLAVRLPFGYGRLR